MSAAALVLAATTALTSCSGLGVPGGAASESAPPPSSSAGPVVDPSVPTATPTASAAPESTAPVASPTPIEKVTATPAPEDSRIAVVPAITSATYDAAAGRLDVSAIVPSVAEGDGTCTVTATLDGVEKTATSKGVAASSYTGCEIASFTGLAAGTYQVRVRYASDTAAGASASRTVRVG